MLLALAFGIGFVGFGVGGSGGGGVGDIIGDVFGREGDAIPSISSAQGKVNDNPNDPDAYFDLARAFQADQRLEDAAAAYEQVVVLRPDDISALRSLASLYQQDATATLQDALVIEHRAAEAGPVNLALFDPDSTLFEIALAEDPLGEALAEGLSASATPFYADAEVRSARWLDALQRLAALEPASQTIQLEIGQAATLAGDTAAAAQAYLRALEIDPQGPRAPVVRTNLRRLGFFVPGDAQADAQAILEAQGRSGGAIFEDVGEGDGAEIVVGPDGSIGEQVPLGSIGEDPNAPAGGSIGEQQPLDSGDGD